MSEMEEQQQSVREEWLPLVPEQNRPLERKQAQLWALVLAARSIPCRIETVSGGYRLTVPEKHLESARAELRLYEEKNRDWPPRTPDVRMLVENTLPTVSVLILLATFHNLTLLEFSLPGHGVVDMVELGELHGAAVREGEWWRLVTSLTLHADIRHLLGNLCIGGAVILLLCRELGSGLAWSLLLGSGILGNLANSWLQSPDHRSLGSSTALFGAVGIFSAMGMVRYHRYPLRRWLVPLAAGAAFLAMMGSEGERTDLGAHLFGFAFGLILGLISEPLLERHGRPGRLANALLALASALVIALAWWLALALS
jgi:membrane associated rhomboid family serine protease